MRRGRVHPMEHYAPEKNTFQAPFSSPRVHEEAAFTANRGKKRSLQMDSRPHPDEADGCRSNTGADHSAGIKVSEAELIQ